jgi:hypothetical protein
MCDPFSVAGGAIGVISFGLTIGEKLAQFADGVISADDEMNALDSALQDFNPILNRFLSLLQEVDLGDSQEMIDTLLRKCLTGFIDINDRLATLRNYSSKGIRKRTLAKIRYSMQSESIRLLVQQLEAVKRDLNTAMQIPILCVDRIIYQYHS